jgi:hypothetical protein
MYRANLQRIATATLFTVCLARGAWAENVSPQSSTACQNASSGKSAAALDRAVGGLPRAMVAPNIANANSEVFQSVIVPAGAFVSLNSTLDYTSAATVAVAVSCSTCATEATSLGNAGLSLNASWMLTNTNSYMFTENKPGNQFTYWDAGAAVFNVYGSQFQLVLLNTGSQAILLTQVTIFQRNQ